MQKFQAEIALTGLRELSRHEAERTFDFETAFMSASAFVRLLAFRAMYGVVLMTLIVLFGAVLPTQAQESTETAKQAQNPIANLISVPLENDFNPQTGIHKDDSYVLEMKPVVPFRLSNDWTLITRTIIPVIQVPDLGPRRERNIWVRGRARIAFSIAGKGRSGYLGSGTGHFVPYRHTIHSWDKEAQHWAECSGT